MKGIPNRQKRIVKARESAQKRLLQLTYLRKDALKPRAKKKRAK